MPIIPTWTLRWNFSAACPLEVKIAVPLPYGLALIEPFRVTGRRVA
jgi:hypothetical protein